MKLAFTRLWATIGWLWVRFTYLVWWAVGTGLHWWILEFISALLGGSSYCRTTFNLNLPGTVKHNFHIFDEQRHHFKKQRACIGPYNGYSVYIPIFLSFSLLWFCFTFVNFIWGDLLYVEVFGHAACPYKDHLHGNRNFVFYLIFILLLLYYWFENISFESTIGYHTSKVNKDYKLGFILFLVSEIMFFFSIFWSFFHFSLSSSLDLGYIWPPVGIDPIPYLNMPLQNTTFLILSGLYVTWSHNSLKVGDRNDAIDGLICTIILGVVFLKSQYCEYVLSNFNLNDSVFGAVFFFGTGFHGMHVLLGVIGLIYNLFKLLDGTLTSFSHYSYLFVIWYWHFVDVIWILLFLVFYAWGQ